MSSAEPINVATKCQNIQCISNHEEQRSFPAVSNNAAFEHMFFCTLRDDMHDIHLKICFIL